MTYFEFIDARGKPVSDDETQGYFVRDFFDCDIATATAEELSATYRGPDFAGIGVRWITDRTPTGAWQESPPIPKGSEEQQ